MGLSQGDRRSPEGIRGGRGRWSSRTRTPSGWRRTTPAGTTGRAGTAGPIPRPRGSPRSSGRVSIPLSKMSKSVSMLSFLLIPISVPDLCVAEDRGCQHGCATTMEQGTSGEILGFDFKGIIVSILRRMYRTIHHHLTLLNPEGYFPKSSWHLSYHTLELPGLSQRFLVQSASAVMATPCCPTGKAASVCPYLLL